MKVLVGIPVFRLADLVRRCLAPLIVTPADILVIDNASDPDVKDLVYGFGSVITVITNTDNGYCNKGWNQIMEYGLNHDYDLIGLGTSDVTLHPGWYEQVVARAGAVTDEFWIPTVGEPIVQANYNNVTYAVGGVAGFFSFLPRKAVSLVYPIPAGLRHWFGDSYMFEKLVNNGWKLTIMNDLRAQHEQSSVTAATPEAYEVIERDKEEWKRLR